MRSSLASTIPRVAILILGALPMAALAACSSGGPASGVPGPSAAFDGASFPPGLRAPGFTLSDQRGGSVSLGEHRGRVRVLAFVSTAERAGALVAQQIRGALDELGSSAAGVKVLLISTDGPTARARVRARGARLLDDTSLTGRAELLTGTASRLRAVWRAYGIPPASAGERAYVSSSPVILIDRAGLERVGFPVEQLTPEALAHDLRALLSE